VESPRVANRTDFVVQPASQYGRDGERVVAIVKSTWQLRRGARALELAPPDARRPIRFADEPWGDPEASSIRYPADVAIDKPGTDVVVVGDAWAPGGDPAPHVDVRIAVGPLARTLRAHGPRTWLAEGEGVSDPQLVRRVPLRWELAAGGRDEGDDGAVVEDARNPLGRGVASHPSRLEGAPAPQIEDVAAPVTRADALPAPAGVGAVGRHWEPRRRHMGTYDAAWLDTRAPLPPVDEDPRFTLVAAPGLHAERPLAGGEAITLVHLSPRAPVLRCALPRVRVEIAFELRGQVVARREAPIDTAIVDLSGASDASDEGPLLVVELVHRAHVAAPRRKRDLVVRVRELPVDGAAAEVAT
jgi:hypothetical protein